ncbi:LysR substrate-binding domain-containing protein [Pseudomonas akapageensis]|uniref:LysR family transcriptional regulator n=1 Tax=Pseudomonas akapageensis TaxID=2609961 RepID=UPI001408EE8E|nr:LysR family transcriptional regulator [Pseudomonas akapageensis]
MQYPDLNLLVALDVLLEEGSVVGAAQRMHLSAPAMSRTLGRVREAFGDPILVRAGRRMVPTPRALELREQVRVLVEQAGGLFRSGSEQRLETLERQFTLRVHDVLVGGLGIRMLEAVRQEAPNCTLRFATDNVLDESDLREGSIDIYLGAPIPMGPEIKRQSLFSTHYVGLASSDHPIFAQDISPEGFAAYPQISVSRGGRDRDPIDVALGKLGLSRKVMLTTQSFNTAIFALPGSDLLLPIPQHALYRINRFGLSLRPFMIPIPLENLIVIQAWHPRFDNDFGHRWLRKTVRQVCAELSESTNSLL